MAFIHSLARSLAHEAKRILVPNNTLFSLSLLLLFSRQSAATKNKTKPKKDKSCALRKRQGEEKDKDKDKEGAEAEDILLAARLRVAQSDRPTGRLNLRGQQTNKQANDSDNDTRTASSPPSKYKYTLTHTTRVYRTHSSLTVKQRRTNKRTNEETSREEKRPQKKGNNLCQKIRNASPTRRRRRRRTKKKKGHGPTWITVCIAVDSLGRAITLH